MIKRNITIIILIMILVLCGCTPAPERDFTDADLLIDLEAFPDEDWVLIDYSETLSDSEGQVSGAYVIMDSTKLDTIARAAEKIFRYDSEDMSAFKYDRFQSYFEKSARSDPVPTPDGFSFSSEIADQWRFGCTVNYFQPTSDFSDRTVICKYIAQYDEFLVFFTIAIEADGITTISIEDLIKVIQAIDTKMSEYLK